MLGYGEKGVVKIIKDTMVGLYIHYMKKNLKSELALHNL